MCCSSLSFLMPWLYFFFLCMFLFLGLYLSRCLSPFAAFLCLHMRMRLPLCLSLSTSYLSPPLISDGCAFKSVSSSSVSVGVFLSSLFCLSGSPVLYLSLVLFLSLFVVSSSGWLLYLSLILSPPFIKLYVVVVVCLSVSAPLHVLRLSPVPSVCVSGLSLCLLRCIFFCLSAVSFDYNYL